MAAGKRVARTRTMSLRVAAGVVLTALVAMVGVAWALTAGEDGSPTSSDEPKATASANLASAAMVACVAEVEAAEAVVAAARKGIGHWTEHIQAQSDLYSGKNSKKKTAAIFKRTRLAGPADQEAYDDARASFGKVHDRDEGSCADLSTGAADAVECSTRMDALQAAMQAAKGGMSDWRSHLKAMADHAAKKFGGTHAQMLWERAYKAAPKNIHAFERADKTLEKTPPCDS